MHQLSGLDAAFLYLESPLAPMHVGGIYLFDGASRADRFDFQAFRTHLAGRLDVARAFRQRLIQVPLNLDHPYWIEDPHFDLDAHLSYQVLPKPGKRETLMALAEQLFSRLLDRQRPLWEITFVEGLESSGGVNKAFALIVKVHHAAADGVSGEEMVWALLDRKPTPGKSSKAKLWQPEHFPSGLSLVARTAARTLGQPFALAKLTGQLAGGAASLAREKIFQPVPLPPLPLTAPATRLNGPVAADRLVRAMALPLHKIQALRELTRGATVNDVVLALCAGALRRYLDAHQELPEKPLVAAVPIATRTRDRWQELGNQVSVMLVSLATDQSDPRQRFQRIFDSVRQARRDYQALGLERLAEAIPPTLTGPIGRLYGRLGLAGWLKPVFNLFITNVPGPRQPLYLGESRLLYHLGIAPIYHGLGLILVITSYLDTLVISAISCREIMPDSEVFIDHLQASFAELEALVAG